MPNHLVKKKKERKEKGSVKPQGQNHTDTGQNSRHTARDKDDSTELTETRQRVEKQQILLGLCLREGDIWHGWVREWEGPGSN